MLVECGELTPPPRSQARIDFSASQLGDYRISVDDSPPKIWCPIPVRSRRSRSRRLRISHPPLHIHPACPQLPISQSSQGEGVLAGQAAGVLGILCLEEYILIRGSTGRDEEEEVGNQGEEAGRADDGLGHSYSVRVRRANTIL